MAGSILEEQAELLVPFSFYRVECLRRKFNRLLPTGCLQRGKLLGGDKYVMEFCLYQRARVATAIPDLALGTMRKLHR